MRSQGPLLSPSPPSPPLPPLYHQQQGRGGGGGYQQLTSSSALVHLYPSKNVDPLIGEDYNIRRAKRLANLSLAFYISSVFLFITDLASLIITFHLVYRTGVITRRRYAIVACAFVELMTWLCVPLFSWYSTRYCNYDDGLNKCSVDWDGWPVLIVWFAVLLGCGGPRTLLIHLETRRQTL